jgi:hypothetical protein
MMKSQHVRRIGAGLGLALGGMFGLTLWAAPVFGEGRSMFDFFQPFSPRDHRDYYAPVERQVDFSRAPAPRKVDPPPANTVLVLGDSMADWLAYGLEDALSDSPELGVIRKSRAGSGLIRYDTRQETQDWAQVAREAIAAEKPKFIVMMLGLGDRQAIRERPHQTRPGAAGSSTAPPLVGSPGVTTPPSTAPGETPTGEQPSAEGGRGRQGLVSYEFRTEPWSEAYARRIDATVAVLRSAGVPVFWVGLPSIRGPKSTSDMLYLNDLFRSRAEKAGATYIDVWDGFVDENGRYVVQGPDVDGQIRRLRVSDGVHFTKAGARKLAHYVEREIRRVMTRGLGPIALPTTEPQPQAPVARPGAPSARPLAGPVIPLTAVGNPGETLLGGGDASAAPGQAIATKVLVNGRAVATPAGRSDDFVWPRRTIAPFNTDPAVATTTDPLSVMKPTAVATVPVPTGEARAVGTSSQRRSGGRTHAQNQRQQQQQQQQQRRNTSRFQTFQEFPGFQGFSFGR